MRRLMLHRERTGERITEAIRRAVEQMLAASEEAEARQALRLAEGDGEQPIVATQAMQHDVATTADGEQRSASA